MATAYTTEAAIELKIDAARLTALLDRDGDGSRDTGLIADAISDAGMIIDSRLAQRLAVPFAAITDSPDTPDIIQVIAKHLVLADLYSFIDTEGEDARHHFDKADTYLNEILAGNLEVVDATRQTAAKSRHVVSYTASTPKFGGVDSDTDERRTRGI